MAADPSTDRGRHYSCTGHVLPIPKAMMLLLAYPLPLIYLSSKYNHDYPL